MVTMPLHPTPWGQATADIDFNNLSAEEITQMLMTPKKASSFTKSYYGLVEKETPMKLQSRFIIPYNDFSKGAKALANELGWQCVKKADCILQLAGFETGDYTIINWGNTNTLSTKGAKISMLNAGEKVSLCADKIKFFKTVKDSVRVPEFTEELSEALKWVEAGIQTMGRRSHGSCGKDIKFYEDDLKEFSTSEFWVKYKKKKNEYRVHIAFGKIIAIQQKALRQTDLEGNKIDTSNVDFRIRNLSHGFIFKRHDIAPPTDVMDQAAAAIKTVGLDFGAVDVIYNETENKAYVLEVNTAPGLEGTTVSDYANAFREHFA